MKKTLLSVLAGLAVINSASAVTRTECEALGMFFLDRGVDTDCIPFFPCEDGAYGAYCVKDFADTQVESSDVARALIGIYIDNKTGTSKKDWFAESSGTSVDHAVGQDYIAYSKDDDSQYLQFEFDDTNDSWDDETFFSTVHGYEIATGYTVSANLNQWIVVRHNENIGVEDEQFDKCHEILDDLSSFLGKRYRLNVDKVKSDVCEYKLN